MLVDFFTSSNTSDESKMKTAKILCGLVCFLTLVSNVWTISRWRESGGVQRYLLSAAGSSFPGIRT